MIHQNTFLGGLNQLILAISHIQGTDIVKKRTTDMHTDVIFFWNFVFFYRIKHLNVKLKYNESLDKIRKATQKMQHMYWLNKSFCNLLISMQDIHCLTNNRDLFHVFVGDFINKLFQHFFLNMKTNLFIIIQLNIERKKKTCHLN